MFGAREREIFNQRSPLKMYDEKLTCVELELEYIHIYIYICINSE